MVQYDPWTGDFWETFDQLRRGIDEVFSRWSERAPTARGAGVYPAVNLFETPDGYILTAELPGLRREDLHVSVEANRVTLRGERRVEPPREPDTSIHRLERPSGVFRRTFELPLAVDADKAEALYRHGVLMLRIPKAPESRPRNIAVKGA